MRPDNTYEVKIDNKKAEGGAIEDDWDILLPSEILDPEATKPEDWDDRSKIPDPEDTKPEVKLGIRNVRRYASHSKDTEQFRDHRPTPMHNSSTPSPICACVEERDGQIYTD